MRACGGVLTLALASALLWGCVDRRYVITTDPPGAVVYRNGQYVGAAPADDHFIYYGKYHFTIVKEGYETLQVDQDISTPWYEFPGIDFFSENLLPYTVIDRREFHYKLEPRKLPDQAQFLQQAQNLREKGLALGPGKLAAQTLPPVVPPGVNPAPGPYPVNPASPYSPNTPPANTVIGAAPVAGAVPITSPPPTIPTFGNTPPSTVPGSASQPAPQR